MVDHEENTDETADNDKKESNDSVRDLKFKQLKKTLTNAEIISQTLLFLLAGYETTSSAIKYLVYNLATNPECQNKLCEEIDQVLEKYVCFINKLIDIT